MSAEKDLSEAELRKVRVEDLMNRRELYKGSPSRQVRVDRELARLGVDPEKEKKTSRAESTESKAVPRKRQTATKK